MILHGAGGAVEIFTGTNRCCGFFSSECYMIRIHLSFQNQIFSSSHSWCVRFPTALEGSSWSSSCSSSFTRDENTETRESVISYPAIILLLYILLYYIAVSHTFNLERVFKK